jgi:hypothetical protein
MNKTFAMLAACSSPPYPPALSTPAGAEREPNSRMWPCVFTDQVQCVPATRRRVCQSDFRNIGIGSLADSLRARISLYLTQPSWTMQQKRTAQSRWPMRGTSSLQSVGHIRLLAPLSAPVGVERGGGDRGGIERQNTPRRLTQAQENDKFNWNLTPIKEGLAT